MPIEITANADSKRAGDNLLALGREYGFRKARAALGGPAKKAMAPVVSDIRLNVPKKTLGLYGTIQARGGAPTKGELRRNPELVYVYRTGYYWRIPGKEFYQAIAVEFGTRHQAAQPVLRTALSRHIEDIPRVFGKELGPAIEKKARQLYNRNLRRNIRR